jgi:hypothetical protein
MATLFDDIVADQGDADLGFPGTRVYYALSHVTAIGYGRLVDINVTDHYLRLGWFAFGSHLDLIDGTFRDYWLPPIYVDFLDYRWAPNPQATPDGSLNSYYTERLRWSFSPGTSVHLLVVGP